MIAIGGSGETAGLLGIIPTHDPNQALRIKRFLMAVLVYLTAVVLMGIYVWLGLMSARAWVLTAGAIVIVNLGFFVVLRSGRNERLGDPSLTALQMIAVCLLMMLTMYQLEQARGALLLLFVVLLMFGMFRLRTSQFMSLGVLALLSYGAAILGVYRHRPTDVELSVELLQLAALAVLVPCGGFFAGYVERLRLQLRTRQVELQRAREAMHELAVQDRLTGISNRGTIIDSLKQECERAARLDLPLIVLVLDLDHLKEINREHGQAVGDQVLRQVASTLSASMRAVDGVGRYSGEEFVVVMPDTTPEAAVETGDRLRERIAGLRFSAVNDAIRICASVGVARYDGDEDCWRLVERALEAADRALATGGNRVVRWEAGNG